MNVWVAAALLLAVYRAVAEAGCGGIGGVSTHPQPACSRLTSYTDRQPYRSCHRRWFRRRCNTRYRVVTKYKTTYYCNDGFTLSDSRCNATATTGGAWWFTIVTSPCGSSKYSNAGANHIGPSIVGGQDARRNEFPGQVRLDLSGALCGGIILNSTTILTAARCVRGKSISGMRVYAGDHDQSSTDSTVQERTVRAVLSHPNFNPSTRYNDVALLTLSTPLTINANVRAACLPTKDYSVTNKDVVISGWGRLSANGTTPAILQYAVVRVGAQSACHWHNAAVGADVLCASDGRGENVPRACMGDSGGPMVSKIGSNWYVVGVSSYASSPGCAAGGPLGYRSVMYHYDFILYGRVTQASG